MLGATDGVAPLVGPLGRELVLPEMELADSIRRSSSDSVET
jgi:hypothetical protein